MALNGWKGGMRGGSGRGGKASTEGRGGNGVQSPLDEGKPVDRDQVAPKDETTGASSKVIKTEE